jgi:hypothetical protein
MTKHIDNGATLALGAAAALAAAGLWAKRGSAASDPAARARHFRNLLKPGSGATEAEQETARARLEELEVKHGARVGLESRPEARPASPGPDMGAYRRSWASDLVPPWETDKRSRFHTINRQDFSDLNFLKKSTFEHAKNRGDKIVEVYLQAFDGRFPRLSVAVYTSLADLPYAVDGFERWSLSGFNSGSGPHQYAVLARYDGREPMYLISIDGMILGAKDHPVVLEEDEDFDRYHSVGSSFNNPRFGRKVNEMVEALRR